MKIGILGTRGIPNQYGGFEQFAQYLAEGLTLRGHSVTVYNVHHHKYQEPEWRGVRLVHRYDPEPVIGTAGQFFYDLSSILHSRTQNYDILLQLGYTSSSVWSFLMPRKSCIVTNMDGLEWKRSKYSPKVRKFLRWAEKIAVRNSDCLVADSLGIQQYLQEEYTAGSVFIPYGAVPFEDPSEDAVKAYGVKPHTYDMLVARMEPENNIEMILDGVAGSRNQDPFLVVGNTSNVFGKYLREKYGTHPKIVFCEGIYDLQVLNNLRYFSRYYFHGHSVGGTNPSLLEAMACKTVVAAHDNIFNNTILGEEALYFSSADEVRAIVENDDHAHFHFFRESNFRKIISDYQWEEIISQYEQCFLNTMLKPGK